MRFERLPSSAPLLILDQMRSLGTAICVAKKEEIFSDLLDLPVGIVRSKKAASHSSRRKLSLNFSLASHGHMARGTWPVEIRAQENARQVLLCVTR